MVHRVDPRSVLLGLFSGSVIGFVMGFFVGGLSVEGLRTSIWVIIPGLLATNVIATHVFQVLCRVLIPREGNGVPRDPVFLDFPDHTPPPAG